MASETKKRLLLSKWRLLQGLQSELDDAREESNATAYELERLESVLLTVRYWMLDALVHHRPVSDPRVILRKVEEAIG